MRNLWLIVKEDFVNLIKNPMWIFYVTGFPIFLILILGYLTGNSYGKEVTSYDYYGITLMIYAALNSGMISANAFLEERIKKPNMRIIYAPGHVNNIYLSKIISTFLFVIVFHIIDMIILVPLCHIRIAGPLYLLVLLMFVDLFAVTLGIMLCCIVKTENMTNQIQSIIINLLAILGGVLFSMDGYGKAARMISNLSPIKWMVRSSFEIIYDHNYQLFGGTVLVLVISILVMLLICRLKFRKEDCIC